MQFQVIWKEEGHQKMERDKVMTQLIINGRLNSVAFLFFFLEKYFFSCDDQKK